MHFRQFTDPVYGSGPGGNWSIAEQTDRPPPEPKYSAPRDRVPRAPRTRCTRAVRCLSCMCQLHTRCMMMQAQCNSARTRNRHTCRYPGRTEQRPARLHACATDWCRVSRPCIPSVYRRDREVGRCHRRAKTAEQRGQKKQADCKAAQLRTRRSAYILRGHSKVFVFIEV